MFDVTLDGAFHCVKACLPHLKQSGAGAIVNIGGLSGQTGSKDRVHVVTAKSGLVGLTRALAHDLAADDVTVNCVAPGLVGDARGRRASSSRSITRSTTRCRASAASRRTSPPSCASCAGRARATSPARPST